MVEQNRVMNLADILHMFKPANLDSVSDKGVEQGFGAMLDKALSQTQNGDAEKYLVRHEAATKIQDAPPVEPTKQTNEAAEQVADKATSQKTLPADPLQGKDKRVQEEAVLRTLIRPDTPRAERGKTNREEIYARNEQRQVLSKDEVATRISLQQDARPNKNIENLNLKEKPEAVLPAIQVKQQKPGLEQATRDEKKPEPKKAKEQGVQKPEQLAGLTQPLQDQQVNKVAVQSEQAKNTAQEKKQSPDATALLNLDQKNVNVESKLLNDAMRVVRELSGKLGLKTEAVSGKTEDGKLSNEVKSDRRLSRTDMLRMERLDPKALAIRVEASAGAGRSGQVTNDSAYKLVSMSGIQSVRVDEASLGKDFAPYNPTLPQSVIHHTITLPSGVAASPANYAQQLKTQLQTSLNSDLVGQAKILLNGSDKGEIKLVLHPESLGEVRINLKIEDSVIGGTIFVENKEVLQAFQDTLADLKSAFAETGLDASLLQLSLGSGSEEGSSGQFARERQNQNGEHYVKQATKTLTDSVPILRFQDAGSSLVDVVV